MRSATFLDFLTMVVGMLGPLGGCLFFVGLLLSGVLVIYWFTLDEKARAQKTKKLLTIGGIGCAIGPVLLILTFILAVIVGAIQYSFGM